MSSVEDKFAQLSPVLDNKIYPLWLAYSLGNRNEKQEIEGAIDVLCHKLLNKSFAKDNILFEPQQAKNP